MRLPPFPEAGEYFRYWDINAKETRFFQIADKRAPLVYFRRLGSVASGGTSNKISLPDLRPSRRLSHRYKVYIGVRPGALIQVSHPSDFDQFAWDEKPQDITENLTKHITHQISPHDAPTFSLWIEPDRYPAFTAINVMERASVPEISIVAAKYRIIEQNAVDKANELNGAIVAQLLSGQLPSTPIYFGGDV